MNSKDIADLQVAVDRADAAANRDSNDEEIDALREALDAALALVPAEIARHEWESCLGCDHPVTADGEMLVDTDGSATCPDYYDDCPACQDGEPHPHWVTDLTTSD